MVAYIKEMAVTRYKWLDEEKFKDGVALCQTIPGATAMQTAAFVGLRARGIAGALASFVGFGLPAFILMLILSSLYARYHEAPGIISLFNGLQVVVVAIVANATYSFGKSTLKNFRDIILAIAASVFFWIGISPFIVILGAAFAGILFLNGRGIVRASAVETGTNKRGVKQLSTFLFILLLGLLILYLIDATLLNLAVLMMKIDLFAFGGGFASLPLMLHEIVNVRGWMDSKTFMDGIALGQVTPGPIVITSTFVGYLTLWISRCICRNRRDIYPFFLDGDRYNPGDGQIEDICLFHESDKRNPRIFRRPSFLCNREVRIGCAMGYCPGSISSYGIRSAPEKGRYPLRCAHRSSHFCVFVMKLMP